MGILLKLSECLEMKKGDLINTGFTKWKNI